MVSKASDDLPEPESPVITTSRSRGDIDVDAFQVVRPGAADANEVHEEWSGARLDWWKANRLYYVPRRP